MLSNEIIIEALNRVKDIVHKAVDGLSVNDLTFRPNDSGNSIAWLVWHLTRGQDDHIADLAHNDQVWSSGWYKKFDLPFAESATGYAQTPEEVASVKVDAKLLLGYHDAVHASSVKFVKTLTEKDYAKIVDKRWDPPVTMAVRLVSIFAEDLQHAGQASYVRGLLTKSK